MTKTEANRILPFLEKIGMKTSDFTPAQLTAMLKFGNYCVENHKKETIKYCLAVQEIGELHRCEAQCDSCRAEILKSKQT